MQRKKQIVYIAAALFLLKAQNLRGQYEERNFTRYTIKEGLSDNGIQTIQQDDRGYIWIGSEYGLNRFDGNRFLKFYTGTAPLQLLSPNITRIKQIGKDELGIISHGGAQLLNTKTYQVRNLRIADSTPVSVYLNSAWDIVRFTDGSYGVTTATGYYQYSREGQLLYRQDAYTQKDIGNRRILYGRDMLRLSETEYVVYVNENKVALFNNARKEFRELKQGQAPPENISGSPFADNKYWSVHYQMSPDEFIFIRGLYNKAVYYNHRQRKIVESVLPASITDSVTWQSKLIRLNDSTLALNSGISGFHLLRIDRRTGVISSNGTRYLRNYKIICLFADKDNRLWAGTTEGLLKQELQPPVLQALHYQPVAGEKFTYGFSAVYRYKDKLYVSRYAYKKGLVILDADSKKLIREISLQSENSNWNEIRSIEMYHPDTLWLGTNGGLLWFDTRSERYGKVLDEKKYPWSSWFFPVLGAPRADGDAWICSMMTGKLVRYHIPTRSFKVFTNQTTPALPFEKVKNIVYDSYGDVWISGHSLARWNTRKQLFDTLIKVYGGENKFSDDIITIRADNNGSLWLHNASNGLLEYKIKEKRFVAHTIRDGLPFDVIYGLSPVFGTKIWMSGNSQISLYDLQTQKATVYDYRDGLPESKPTAKRIYYDSLDQCLYLCCNEYLVKFPVSPPVMQDRSSELLLEEAIVDYEETTYFPGTWLRIPNNRNNLTLRCSIIDFDKSNHQFAWRFKGAPKWNALGDQRSISLNNLPPGNYSIEVKASGQPGVEKTILFSFLIRPPVWKRAWFIVLAVLVLGSLAYFIYRRRISTIRQRAEIDRQLSQTEMKALQAQMNPHFIFNSLNSIREMILNNENREASHYLSKFAHLMRITLDQSGQHLVSLRNTIDYLQRYLEMEQIRNSLLSFGIHVGADIDQDEILVPPMLIQPFIENGLWHGVAAHNKTIHIDVHFRKENNCLFCTVEDNGIGLNQSEKNRSESAVRRKSHGIINIKKRIQLLNEKHGLQCRVNIRDKQDIPGSRGSGTVVTICLPLEINEE